MPRGVSGVARAVALPAALIGIWQVAVVFGPDTGRMPQPTKVAQAGLALVASGELLAGILQSLGRVFGGFLVAGSIALPLGLLMGGFRTVERNIDPLIESFRPVAAIAILPLAILWFGTGTPAAIFIVAYAAFFPLVVNTVAGVKRVDRRLVAAARTMGVRTTTILCWVIIPSALPQIGVGLRLGLGVAWTAIIAAELAVGAKSGGGSSGGIGQMMFVYYAYSVELNSIVVCMMSVGLVALILDRGLRHALTLLMPWSRT
jgi:ABC-type nitrate/sulfonate/bicarbonate transport system permease component